MNKIKSLMTISALSIMVLILPAIASAQYGGGYGNGGYNNGQYGNNGYYTNIKSTVRDLKDRSKDLKKEIDRLDDRRNNGGWNNGGYGNNNGGWNNGGYGNGGYNNNVDVRSLKNLADQFRKAADKLEDRYDDGRDQYKSSNEARRVLELGSQLDREIRRSRLNLYNWNQISNDLRIVANAYNNNGGRGNGGWGNGRGNGNGRNGMPSWWPF
ncbi:MAG: hypothetical protein WBC19_03545 [Pyrinomonadaceae bacterium]|nr:hypothetical protein [Chloracidobacterium sp.]MBP7415110.1 hypothetical protein [Pyrinomonadaceae bacterium]